MTEYQKVLALVVVLGILLSIMTWAVVIIVGLGWLGAYFLHCLGL